MPVNPDHILSQEPAPKPFLLAPLGWLYDDLEPLWHTHPEIIQVLLSLGHPQVHGLALVACTAQTSLTVQMLRALAERPLDQSLALAFDPVPKGLGRILRVLADPVMSRQSYRHLAGLLATPTTATWLRHCPVVVETTIDALAALPTQLRRPAVVALIDKLNAFDRLVPRFMAVFGPNSEKFFNGSDPAIVENHTSADITLFTAAPASVNAICVTTSPSGT
jgi:hypothetical protein